MKPMIWLMAALLATSTLAADTRPKLRGRPGPSVAIEGYCAVTLVRGDRLAEGKRAIFSRYAGKTFWFQDLLRKKVFDADPARFSYLLEERFQAARAGLALSGWCPVFLVDEDMKMRGLRFFTMEYDGRIYRFASEKQRAKFKARPQFYHRAAIPAYQRNTGGALPLVEEKRPSPSRIMMRR